MFRWLMYWCCRRFLLIHPSCFPERHRKAETAALTISNPGAWIHSRKNKDGRQETDQGKTKEPIMKTLIHSKSRQVREGRSVDFRTRWLGVMVGVGFFWAVSALAQESLFDYVSSLQGDAGVLTNYDIVTRYATLPVEFLKLSGDQLITTNTFWGSTNNDARMLMVRVEGDLTVQAGATLTAAARKRGMIVQVRGDTVVAGTITMTARGAANVPGDQLLLISAGGVDYEVPAVGGAGGAGRGLRGRTHGGRAGGASGAAHAGHGPPGRTGGGVT